MKQFEEWWDNLDTNDLPKDFSLFEEGWKAALMWFRQRTYNFNHAWAIQAVIDEELEEE